MVLTRLRHSGSPSVRHAPSKSSIEPRSQYDTVPTRLDARSNATPWCAVRSLFTRLLPPPPLHPSSSTNLVRATGRGALDGRLGVGLGQVLDVALLAVLYPHRANRRVSLQCSPFARRFPASRIGVAHLPSTWRTSAPAGRGARRRVSCPPSGCGARRGQRRRGSGCSCEKGEGVR